MENKDLFNDLINILESMNNFLIGLTVFVFILFVSIYGLIQIVVQQQKEILFLKGKIQKALNYVENQTNWKD